MQNQYNRNIHNYKRCIQWFAAYKSRELLIRSGKTGFELFSHGEGSLITSSITGCGHNIQKKNY